MATYRPHTVSVTVSLSAVSASQKGSGYKPVIPTPPVIETPMSTYSYPEDSEGSINLYAMFSDREDLDSELTYTFSGNTNINISVVDGVATVTNQVPDWYGTETIVFRATDTEGLFVEQSVDITSTPVVDIVADSYNVLMDTQTDFDVLVNDTFEGTPVVTVTTSPINGTTNVVANVIEYTPTTSYVGSDTLTYTVTSGLVTELVQVNIAVVVNTAPSATVKAFTTPYETTLVFTDAQLLVGSSDPQGDTVTVESVSYTGSDGVLTDNLDGTYDFAPSVGYSGDTVLTFTVTDSLLNSTDTNITVTVSPDGATNGDKNLWTTDSTWRYL